MNFFKRYLKCLFQRKMLFIVLVIICSSIGLIGAYKIYNPVHEYYKLSFKSSSVKEISLDDLDDTKSKIEEIRENGKYIIINDYLVDVSGAISASQIDKSEIFVTYSDKTETIYGTLDKNLFSLDGKDYIIVDDYWVYPKNSELSYKDGKVILKNGENEEIYIGNSDLEYHYSYSSFNYLNTKKIYKTSKIDNSDSIYTIYMQKRHFNSWQQARRFMVRYVSYIALDATYITNNSDIEETKSINMATSKTNMLETKGTNIYICALAGGALGIFMDFVVILVLVLIKKEDAIDNLEYDNKEVFKSPFHKNYFKSQLKPFKNIKDIAFLALLLAMMQIVRLIPLPSGFGNLGISLSSIFFALIGLIYGPTVGFVIGIISDIFGFFVFPDGYPFHIGYTLQAGLVGFVYGIMFYKTKITFSKVLFARLIVNIILNAILGSFLWADVADLSASAMKTYMLTLEIPKNVLYLLPQTFIIYLVFKALSPALKALGIVDFRICDDLNKRVIEELDLENKKDREIL